MGGPAVPRAPWPAWQPRGPAWRRGARLAGLCHPRPETRPPPPRAARRPRPSEDVLPQPHRESRRRRVPSARPGPFFPTPSSSGPGRTRPAPRRLPAPTLGLRDCPTEAGPASPGWGAAQPSPPHTEIIFPQQRKSSPGAGGGQGGWAWGAAAARAAPRGGSAGQAPGAARGAQRQSARPCPIQGRPQQPLSQRAGEGERERSGRKVFRVQTNLKVLRRRAYLNSEGAIFQRVLRTCGLDTSGPKIDNLNDQAAHVACKRVKWSPASVRLYVMWYIMLDVNSPKP